MMKKITAPAPDSPRTVSLALGSGSARGLAHIGIIQWLQENNYCIQSVAGSSIGAVVGGIFAAGKLPAYTKWVQALTKADVLMLLDLSFSRAGLFKGDRIVEQLKELIGEFNIEDLAVSFTAVATDVMAGREVWLNRGSLFDAIRASFAIPTLFTPFDYQGRRLLDGGLINPVPIAPTLKDATDITIAVNLNGSAQPQPPEVIDDPPGDEKENHYKLRIRRFVEEFTRHKRDVSTDWGFIEVIQHSFDCMQSTISRLKLAAYTPDVIVVIPKNACGHFEYYRAAEMIALGRRMAQQAMAAH